MLRCSRFGTCNAAVVLLTGCLCPRSVPSVRLLSNGPPTPTCSTGSQQHTDTTRTLRIRPRRQYLKDPQVKLFAMFTGIVSEDYLGHEPWQFLLKCLYCVRLLMDVNWKLLVKSWPTDRGAPLPLPAIMDLLANLYNAENPTELQVRLCSFHACMRVLLHLCIC